MTNQNKQFDSNPASAAQGEKEHTSIEVPEGAYDAKEGISFQKSTTDLSTPVPSKQDE